MASTKASQTECPALVATNDACTVHTVHLSRSVNVPTVHTSGPVNKRGLESLGWEARLATSAKTRNEKNQQIKKHWQEATN